eukprot:86396-Chlamydomonas_euryale.AAC.21
MAAQCHLVCVVGGRAVIPAMRGGAMRPASWSPALSSRDPCPVRCCHAPRPARFSHAPHPARCGHAPRPASWSMSVPHATAHAACMAPHVQVCTGAKSEEDSRTAARKVGRMVETCLVSGVLATA